MTVHIAPIALCLIILTLFLPKGVLCAQEMSQTDEIQRLEEFCRENIVKPLRINHLSGSELEGSGLFSQWQSALIVNYRKESGGIRSAYELVGVLGWDTEMVGILENYISFELAAKGRSGMEYYTKVRGKPLENWSEVKQKEGYIGLPVSLLNRLSASSTLKEQYLLDCGIILSNSRGERFADFISGYMQAQLTSHRQRRVYLQKLVIGDMSVRFGQGVTIWSSSAWNTYGSLASSSGAGYARRGEVLSGRNSQSEDNLLRGVGCSLGVNLGGNQFRRMDITAFVSDRLRDARIENGFYTTLSSGGDHSTRSLLETKHRMNEFTTGMRVTLEGGTMLRNEEVTQGLNLKLGFNAIAWFYNRYNAAFHSTSGSDLNETALYNEQAGHAEQSGLESVAAYKRYQQFDWWHGNFSIDMYMTCKRLIVYSECAVDAGGHTAFLAGCSTRLAQWEVALHTHLYSKSYIAPFSGALSATSTTSNQHSASLQGTRYLSGRWQFSTAIAATYFPWCRYQVPYSSLQLRAAVCATLKLHEMSHTLNLDWRGEHYIEAVVGNVTGGGTNGDEGKTTNRFKAKLSSSYELFKGSAALFSGTLLSASVSALVPDMNSFKTDGSATGNNLSMSVQAGLKFPYLLSLTAGAFSVPLWSGRLYGHTSSMPYGSSSILLYGEGFYYGLMLKFNGAFFQVLGTKPGSWINRFAIWCGVSGVSYFSSSLNQKLERKDYLDFEVGLRFRM